MNNLRIGKKLTFCFLILFSVLITVGGIGLYNEGKLNDASQEIGVERLVRLESAAKLNVAMSDVRIAQAAHVLATTPEIETEAENNLKSTTDIINEQVAFLEKELVIPSSIAMLGAFKANWAAYQTASERMIADSRASRDDAAIAGLRASLPAYKKANIKAEELQALQSKLMSEAAVRADQTYSTGRIIIVSAIVVAGAAVLAMLLMLIRGIATPLNAMTGALGQLAGGKLDVQVPVEERRDEVGDLATAMKKLRDQLLGAERAKEQQATLIVDSVGTGLSALAQGDLTARVDAELTGPFARLKTDFNKAMDAMGGAMVSVSSSAEGIMNGSNDIRQASDDLSRRTEQQAASLEETAAAMHEITTTVKETAQGASRANGAVIEARDDAQKSGEIVKRAVEAMNGIERSSSEISDIIAVIDGIAFQTNLLALNARVEAARAGDAGKGFAVVASEVRALAQRSADAAKDVKTRINTSTQQVELGAGLVAETGEALTRISTRIGEISKLVAHIADSAEQQATGLQQVNTAVTEMDSVTQQNAAMVEEATAAARSLADEAQTLAVEVSRFKLDHRPMAPVTTHASPVHQLQARIATPAKRTARAPQSHGNAAVAVADDSWSEF